MSDDPALSVLPPFRPRAAARWGWRLLLDVIGEYRRDRIADVAAGMTFWMVVSIPAGLLALVSALGWLEIFVGEEVAADASEEVERIIRETLVESEALQETVFEIFNSPHPGVFTITSLIAFYTLSRGFAGLIRGLDVAYEVQEGRGWLRLRVLAFGLGVATVLVVGGIAVVLAVLSGSGVSSGALVIPLALIVLITWAAVIFHVAPNRRTLWRHDLPGAVLTAVGWIVAPQGFAIYVRLSAPGNQVTSTLGAIVLALMLLYTLCVLMILGAELNDVLARRSGRDGAKPSGGPQIAVTDDGTSRVQIGK